MLRKILLAVAMAVWAVPAGAQMRMSGVFTAGQACPAAPSIRGESNPGGIAVEPGRSYRIVGANRQDATHYLIVVPGADPAQRWVAVGCGRIGEGRPAAGQATHVLALGWEPAFCGEHRDKPECRRETAQSPEARQLSLHGLWPQPRGKAYCGVDRRLAEADRAHDWASLPEPEIGRPTFERLAAVMPGVQSGLQRHEWIVHGTCFGGSADAYFARAASLAEQVNASPVRTLFVQHIGGTLGADEIRGAFDAAFGPGAGARVRVSCPGPQRLIGEIVISLGGDVTGSGPIGLLIQAAAPVAPGCPAGTVAQPGR